MTKEERGEMIRERFGGKGVSAAARPEGEARKTAKWWLRYGKGIMARGRVHLYDPVGPIPRRRLAVLEKVAPKPKQPKLRVRRRKSGPSAITRIARKLADPRLPKLARKYVWQADI